MVTAELESQGKYGIRTNPREDHARYMRAWVSMLRRDDDSRLTLMLASTVARGAVAKIMPPAASENLAEAA